MTWDCPVCGKTCASREAAQKHCYGQNYGRTYKCNRCGAIYYSLDEARNCRACRQHGEKICPTCRGSRYVSGRICTKCLGTGRVSF